MPSITVNVYSVNRIGKCDRNKQMRIVKLNAVLQKAILVRLNLMRYCFESGLAPSSWMRSIIAPVPNGAESCVPLNYRGSSLFVLHSNTPLPVLSKIDYQ